MDDHGQQPPDGAGQGAGPGHRHADIKVVDVSLSPEPAERDELGRLEWVATLAPDQKWQASIRYGVEHPKETQVAGWGS